jgi:hypothetical protein
MSDSFIEFWYDSPFLSLVAIICLSCLLEKVFFSLPNRFFRHLNVRSKGWPPAHLDLDGDPIKKEED